MFKTFLCALCGFCEYLVASFVELCVNTVFQNFADQVYDVGTDWTK